MKACPCATAELPALALVTTATALVGERAFGRMWTFAFSLLSATAGNVVRGRTEQSGRVQTFIKDRLGESAHGSLSYFFACIVWIAGMILLWPWEFRITYNMIHIQKKKGDRADLLRLFRIADESESEIQSYSQLGDVLVALDDGKVVGIAQVEKDDSTVQIISLAVVPERQREGIGCRLIEEAANYCRYHGVGRLIVCTGAWEAENIAFYTKRGFALFHIIPDFFTLEKGYAKVGDQVQFEMNV
jgi:N-acetylglutamate synthase-like GNAT family acetyltransferase